MTDAAESWYADRFAGALRQARLEIGMSQTEVAEATGLDNSTISKWEKDGRERPPVREQIRDLERVLEIDDQSLLDAAGYKTEPRGRRSLSYGGQTLSIEDEREVLEYIEFVRRRTRRG